MGAPLWLSVIGTAIALGVVHVMTGPDHLSALSTLSVGKPLRTAFGLGVRWGCGHSFGLLIVAIIFFAVGQSVNLDTLTYYADMFVGIFMIVLGSWYTLKAVRERMRYLQSKEDELLRMQCNINDNDIENGAYDMNVIQNIEDELQNKDEIELQAIDENIDGNDKNEKMIENNEEMNGDENPAIKDEQVADVKKKKKKDHSDNDDESSDDDIYCFDHHPFVRKTINSEKAKLKSYQNDVYHGAIPDDDMIIDANASLNPLFDPSQDREEGRRTKCITRVAAFIAGIFHGVAGPGGVLGVMIALKLNDWFFSSLYLIMFFISSIITMGFYATLYGFCTQRMTVCANNKQKCAFILKIISAIFSLIIGVLWICLTFTGTLQKWFD